MSTILSLENISFIRQGKPLLHNISWQVQSGEHWAILGLNGAGKSTLLRLLTGEFWPSHGQISVLGHTFGHTDMTSLRQKIGMVSSFISERIPHDMLAEKIVLTGKYKSSILYKVYSPEELSDAKDMLIHLKADHLIGRPYYSLSQGEKQVVLVARSLMEKPELLILDEATSGLDLLAREKLLSQLQQIATLPQAPTLLYVTHHAEEISDLFTHTLLLKGGELIAHGKKEDVLRPTVLKDFYDYPVELIALGDGRIFIKPILD